MEVGTIKGPDGSSIFVELTQAAVPLTHTIDDLPEGAEPTGIADRMEDAVERLKKTIGNVIGIGKDAIAQHGPDEWKLEFEIGFSGKAFPIPVLVSSEAEAVLKITATWKKA